MPSRDSHPRFHVKLPETLDLDALEALAREATPGPWMWSGHKGHDFYLSTQRWGRRWVMMFRRLGMSGAQPVFQHYEFDERKPPEDPLYWSGVMKDGKEIAIYDHNGEVLDIDNADARYIVTMSPDVVLKLIEMARDRSEE